jgi:hypothetical protein
MTMLAKITEKEARAFVGNTYNKLEYPLLHATITAWLETKHTSAPCYNIKWNNRIKP